MDKHERNAGVVVGGASVITLLVCIFAAHLSVIVSLVVAALVFAAAALLMPGGALNQLRPTEKQARAMQASREAIGLIREHASRLTVASPLGFQLLDQLAERAEKVLSVIQQDRNKFKAAEPFYSGCMKPIVEFIPNYTRLAERQIGKEQLAEAEQKTLPRLIAQIDEVFERLHTMDVAWLETDLELTLPQVGDVRIDVDEGRPQ